MPVAESRLSAELGHGGDEHERRGHEEQCERKEEVDQVADPLAVERGREQRGRGA